ncbi:MAG: MurR/RpiR family transcriptional regulator [Ruminococcaceae bacterium]|nr:MurR/RpiR family transcriptional regulator [Oscillospiraceae bacterium]
MIHDAISHITGNYSKLTESEKKLADYILLHYNDAVNMNVQDLAEKAEVSSAAVIRFAQHMGFDGYTSFRLFLAQRRPEHEDFILDLKKNRGTAQEQVEKVINASIEAIRLTAYEMDYESLERTAEAIKGASRLLLFGAGSSHIVCDDASHKFQRLGKHAISLCDTHMAIVNLNNFDKNDLVIGISHSGENADVCKILNAAQKSGISTLAITTFAGSPVCEFADFLLYTKTRESPLHKIAFTSRISQFAAIDSLVMAYILKDYDRCMQNIDRLSTQLKNI